MSARQKVVLAYSGGLDTSIMIVWLIENYNCDVVAMCADLGQGEELDGLREKAINSGASEVFIEDLRDEFIRDYIYPTLQAGAIYERNYLLGTSFARPLIAKRQVEIAHKVGATMVAHGATGKGNDQVRFELTYMALDPSLTVIAPWKDPKWTMHSREECVAYAQSRGIPIAKKNRLYSEDRNIWHISHEGLELEDPANAPEDAVFSLSVPVEKAPDAAAYVEIGFQKGIPVSVNGETQSPLELLTFLNTLGGAHAIGQIDMVENRLVGIKSRGVYETPGGTLLYAAHRELEALVLDRDTMHLKHQLAGQYADLVYDGKWFTPVREALDAFVKVTQQSVTGRVRMKLYKGNVIPAGSWADESLYLTDLASFSDTALYDQKDASGFIRLFGLPMKVRGLVQRRGTHG
ncbi:MAG: argininosuccinate synthase [Candidatus Margulisiibacteriota bacterium]